MVPVERPAADQGAARPRSLVDATEAVMGATEAVLRSGLPGEPTASYLAIDLVLSTGPAVVDSLPRPAQAA